MGEGRTVSTLDLGKSLKHPETAECFSKLNIVGDKANQASCKHWMDPGKGVPMVFLHGCHGGHRVTI